jgi:hypothetical protein
LAWFGIGLYKKQLKNNWTLFLIASLNLSLAPFSPPYIWDKLQCPFGGNSFSSENGMQR